MKGKLVTNESVAPVAVKAITLPRGRRLPSVTVIIPTRNGAATLPQQLEALRGQCYDGPWEVLVVDNDSSDRTVAVVAAFLDVMPNLRLIPACERHGRGYAINCGARAARGEVFLFCDADDVAAPGWLAAMAEALSAHALVVGATEIERLNERRPGALRPHNSASHRSLGFLPHATGCNSGVRREVFEAAGGFDQLSQRAQDIEFSWRLQQRGYRIHEVPAAVMHYRLRGDLRGIWRQTTRTAVAHAWLYARFGGQGMPRDPWAKVWEDYWWLLRTVRTLPRRDYNFVVHWLYKAALRWGRLLGSIRYGVWYP